MLVVALGTLVVPFDSSVNFAFPFITRAFGLPIPAIQWVVIAYTLTYAALMLVFGRVGDMLGYRRIFLAGSLWSAVAFVLCALAPSYGCVAGGARAARRGRRTGAELWAGAGDQPVSGVGAHAGPRHLYHGDRHRRRAGTADRRSAGAADRLAGGVLVPRAACTVSRSCWRWLLPADARPAHRERFDAAGGVLLVLAISAMLLALNQLQHIASACRCSPLRRSCACSRLSASSRRNAAPQRPIIDLRFFRDFDFSLLNAGHAALNLAGFSVLLLVPFYLSRFGGLTAYATGLLLACSPAGTVVAAPLAARLAARVAAAAARVDRRRRHGDRAGADRHR